MRKRHAQPSKSLILQTRSLNPFTYTTTTGLEFQIDSACLNKAALKAGGSKQELLYLQFLDIVYRKNANATSADINELWQELIQPGKAEKLATEQGITLQIKSTRKSGRGRD